MPVARGEDSKGPFYRWGHRTKYYYIAGNVKSRLGAKMKATKQSRAAYANGYRGWKK